SPLAWPIVRDTVDAFLAIPDRYAEDAMRRYARPLPGDPPIESGESGSAGLAALLALRDEAGLAPLAEKLGLTPQTRVLILNTEGATDPVHYRQVVGQP
ncbi:MAG TPA: diaminopropionate ammonia-lyase, partial [Candidatus Aminicenantes bacterium]|nr:diaminopropionate ammonia-lyase [Candidatus Aminicenantes bacterium]